MYAYVSFPHRLLAWRSSHVSDGTISTKLDLGQWLDRTSAILKHRRDEIAFGTVIVFHFVDRCTSYQHDAKIVVRTALVLLHGMILSASVEYLPTTFRAALSSPFKCLKTRRQCTDPDPSLLSLGIHC